MVGVVVVVVVEVYLYSFFSAGARSGSIVTAMPRPLYSWERYLAHFVREAGWAPGPVWTGAEDLAPTALRSADSPACSEALYRLSYPGQPRIAIDNRKAVPAFKVNNSNSNNKKCLFFSPVSSLPFITTVALQLSNAA